MVGPTPNNLARLAKMFGHLQTLGAQGRTCWSLEQALGMKAQVVGPTPNNLARLAKMFGHLQTLGAQGRTCWSVAKNLEMWNQVFGASTWHEGPSGWPHSQQLSPPCQDVWSSPNTWRTRQNLLVPGQKLGDAEPSFWSKHLA